jgi:hypothetical protein
MYIYIISETPQKDIKSIRMPLNNLISPTIEQCPMSTLTADSVHRETPPPLDLSPEVVKTHADTSYTGPKSIRKLEE